MSAASRDRTPGAADALQLFVSGTVVSNGGDAAIHAAQVAAVRSAAARPVHVTMADSATEVARRLFPDATQVERLWPHHRHELLGAGRLGVVLRRALWARVLLAARLPAVFDVVLLTRRERSTMRAIRNADLVAYAGGTSLIEKYDFEPKLLELRVALSAEVPVVLMPASMGPFEQPSSRATIKPVVDGAAAVLVRDPQSRAHLEAIGCRLTNTFVVPDIVFHELTDAAIERLEKERLPAVPKVVVSMRDIRRFATTGGRGHEEYLDAVAALVCHLVLERAAGITFASTCQGLPSYWTDDSRSAEEVLARLPADVAARCVVDRAHRTPGEMHLFLASADLVIASRMHAAIMSLNVGTPVVPIAYEFKTHQLFQQLGCPELVTDIEGIVSETLIARVRLFLEQEPTLRSRLADGLRLMAEESLRTVEHLSSVLPGSRPRRSTAWPRRR